MLPVQKNKFQTLMQIAALINSTLDQDEIRRRAIEAATTLMDAEGGSLLLVDQKQDELYFEVALGTKGDQLKEIRLQMGQGIAGWVAQHCEPLIVNDAANDPRFFQGADNRSSFVTRQIIAAPVVSKGCVLGVLQAVNSNSGGFTADNLELFVTLADHVAPAIENARLYEKLKVAFHDTALALAEALELRDAYTGGHTRRVRDYSLAAGRCLGLSAGELDDLDLAAVLHDIGKIGVRDAVLLKESKLVGDELALMNSHADHGGEILKHVTSLERVTPAVLHHHERYDGRGYPHGLTGEAIPLLARIIAVADTYDAMTSDRPYRNALSSNTACSELQKGAGSQFDPKIVNAFLAAYAEAGTGNGEGFS
jgi:HD-GYP domain-containing protein (c-di-GMP phosphodiesterase class II)